MIALLCAALSGVMFYFSQGLDNVWGLAWIAPLPVLWLAYGDTPRWQVFLAGLAAFAWGQVYLIQAYGMPLLTTVLAMMFGCGALFAGCVLLAGRMQRTLPPMAALFGFPALWTACEYLVGLVSPHGSFGSIAYSQVSYPAAIQLASLFGLYAVSFLLCLFANALAFAARGQRPAGWAGVLLCVAALGFGYLRLATPQGETVRVAALADWGARRVAMHHASETSQQAMAAEYAAAARTEAARGARLIVIPEGSMLVDPAWRGAALAPLADVARAQHITLVVGTVWVKPWRNTAIAFLPDGTSHVYDKRHLLGGFEDDFVPGKAPGLLGGMQAMAICKDLDFPRTLRSDALAGASQDGIRLMAVPANDFVKDDWIHARMAVMRGVENGFAVTRSAFNGIATVSDAQGRILASARTTAPGLTVVRASVAPGPGPTLYTRIGDIFAWLSLMAATGLMAAAVLRPLADRSPRRPARTQTARA